MTRALFSSRRVAPLVVLALTALTVNACTTPATHDADVDHGEGVMGELPPGATADGASESEPVASPAPSPTPPAREPDGGDALGGPCVAAGQDVSRTPTPGRCDGAVAETCDVATSRLRREVCGPDSECTTFELEERRYDRDHATGWLPSRKIPWAACVPKGAAPCALAFVNGWTPTERPVHSCDGDARVFCTIPNKPTYPTYSKDGWQLTVGATSGFRMPTPCPSGQTCRVALAGEDATACIAKGATACDAQTAPRCAQSAVTYCDTRYGYETTTACAAGRTCTTGCEGRVLCADASAPRCDPTEPTTQCATATSVARCSSTTCRSEVEDCSRVLVYTPGKGTQYVAGRCAVVEGAPRCIRATDVLCDASSFTERCDGSRAVRCRGGLERPADCGASGRICEIAQGHAGCRAANAPTCTAGTRNACAGSSVVGCCGAAGESPIYQAGNTPCVPGYEVRHDCASDPGMTCRVHGMLAECAR